MSRPRKKSSPAALRNPERTRARILQAALAEFAAKGFAGARVDNIARRAAVNKRMLYHYFGNKEVLFRSVLRAKISERQVSYETAPANPEEGLACWFDLARNDVDWIRLLEWEALLHGDRTIIDEPRRRNAAAGFVSRIRQRQKGGSLSGDFDPAHFLVGLLSLTTFPFAFPQLTRLITGRSPSDPRFQNEHRAFLKRLATTFSP